ncbi:MAG: DUF3047 domain-containing protein [Deltaproteobacteria bacterium]|nr:DUF3047 domain-containing protein [Deltaproteobacteria bacterium]
MKFQKQKEKKDSPEKSFLYLRWFRRPWIIISILFLLLSATILTAGGEATLLLGFRMGKDSKTIPEGWEYLTYLGTAENTLSLRREEKVTVLHVTSLNSASALLKRMNVGDDRRIRLENQPILVWRWKINRTVGMAVESRKDRNDSAARVRVIFAEQGMQALEKSPGFEKIIKHLGVTMPNIEPSGFKIDYIWGTRALKGEIIDYPGSRNHKMIVVESGNSRANQWVWEKRDLVKDFHTIFRGDPPGLAGIVVLTDTDQTNEGVEAYYSSIVLMHQ